MRTAADFYEIGQSTLIHISTMSADDTIMGGWFWLKVYNGQSAQQSKRRVWSWESKSRPFGPLRIPAVATAVPFGTTEATCASDFSYVRTLATWIAPHGAADKTNPSIIFGGKLVASR